MHLDDKQNQELGVVKVVANYVCVTSSSTEDVEEIETIYPCTASSKIVQPSTTYPTTSTIHALEHHDYAKTEKYKEQNPSTSFQCSTTSTIHALEHHDYAKTEKYKEQNQSTSFQYPTTSTIHALEHHEYAKKEKYKEQKPSTSFQINKALKKKTGPHCSFVHSPWTEHDYVAGLNTTGSLEYDPVVKDISQLCNTSSDDAMTDGDIDLLTTALKAKSSSSVASTALDIISVRNQIIVLLSKDFSKCASNQNKRVHGDVSTLMKKSFLDLRSFAWSSIVWEMNTLYPELVTLLATTMLKPEKQREMKAVNALIPKLGLIYGILLQTHNAELSKVQRVITTCLADNICAKKVNIY